MAWQESKNQNFWLVILLVGILGAAVAFMLTPSSDEEALEDRSEDELGEQTDKLYESVELERLEHEEIDRLEPVKPEGTDSFSTDPNKLKEDFDLTKQDRSGKPARSSILSTWEEEN